MSDKLAYLGGSPAAGDLWQNHTVAKMHAAGHMLLEADYER